MFNERSDKLELLRIADAVASEKSIDKELILSYGNSDSKGCKNQIWARNSD